MESAVPVTPSLDSPKTTAVLGGDFDAFQKEQRAEERGDTSAPTKPTDPAPVTPPKEAASTDAPVKAASEPAKPVKNADTRVQELLADRAAERQRAERLERELADLRTKSQSDATPAASSPAPATVSDAKRYLAMPDAPKSSAFDNYDEYQAEVAVFIANQRFAERESARDATQQQRHAEQALVDTATKFQTRVQTFTETVPDFADRLSADVKAILPSHFAKALGQPVTALNALGDEFLEAEDGPRLMQHFSEVPGELQRFARLEPKAFFGELALLRAGLTAAANAPPPPKYTTDAPAPPPTLGTRPAEPDDARRAAVLDGDFTRFQAEQRRRDRRT